MPDYGHPLRFGSFITPVNAPASAPVRLAVLSEELGLDLVTFQDHPYQASFLDTWTLLSWAGAHTERVQLSGNVLNLPLRQPAVLARSAASLDLLSGGRVSLGIGAGGLWDAIEAMGGRRLEPGQAVDALDEAIDVIRGIWDAADRRALRVEGDYYRVAGAKRGPAPAHEIPVWVGAYKSRMLRLVGRKADGWLPSLPHLQPGDLRRGNQVIDEAAAAAGRDPREIARLLNVTPRESADDLVSLALEEGIGTFIMMGDDADALRRFATETVPAVRERVAAARAVGGVAPAGRIRSSAALAKRRAGIDYDGLPASLAPQAVEPGDAGYARYTSGYLRGGAPGLVLRASTVGQVRDAVGYAARHRDVPLGIFSAGHGLSGRSLNNGEVILGAPQGGRQYAQAMLVVDSADPDTIIERLQPIADIAPLVNQSVGLARYDQIMQAMLDNRPQQGQGEPHAHSGLIRHITPAFAADAAAMLESGATYFFQLRAVGGAVSDVPADATAYGWRDANFSVVAFGTRHSGLDPWWERLLPHMEGLYLSFESATGPEVVARAFPPRHLARLTELKRRYDPTGLFRDNFFIDPA